MIVSLVGENSFALHAELEKRVKRFVEANGELALERIDAQEVEMSRITESLASLPFLSSQKLVVLRAPSTNKLFVERAEQILADIPETTDVIIVETKLDKRLAYYKYLKKSTDFHEFQELDISGLSKWLSDEAKRKGGNISSSDARYLVERAGANQQLLSNELEKLLLYKPSITRDTIDKLTEATPQSTIFELLEAAFAGNSHKAMQLYDEQRALKVEPPQIIAMLSWQLNILAIIKTAGERSNDQIAKEAKLNPFVVNKSRNIARKLSLQQLKTYISDLLDIDIKTKSTNIDSDDALRHYLLKLAY